MKYQNLKELTPEQLRLRFKSDAVLLLLDCPLVKLGLDNSEWKISKQFKGLKFVPFGTHLLHFEVNQEPSAPKYRQFIYLDCKERIAVLRWSHQRVRFQRVQRQEQEAYKTGADRFQFDEGLGVYPQQNKAWYFATKFIRKSDVERLQSPEFEVEGQQKMIVKLSYGYSGLPSKPRAAAPEKRTVDNFDSSRRLLDYFRSLGSEEDLVAELQFSFLAFLYGHDYESFQHWKELVSLLASCESAICDEKLDRFWQPVCQAIWSNTISLPTELREQLMEGDGFLGSRLNQMVLIMQGEPRFSRFVANLKTLGITGLQQGDNAPYCEEEEAELSDRVHG